MEVVPRPPTPTQIQPYQSDTKDVGKHAPEVVQQYQEGNKIGSPALLIYHPQTPAPPPPFLHQPSWQREHPIQSPGPFPIVPPYQPHGDSPTLIAPPVDPPQPDYENRICGIRRKVFAVLLALAFLTLVGVGVGVGIKIGVVDQNRSDNSGYVPSRNTHLTHQHHTDTNSRNEQGILRNYYSINRLPRMSLRRQHADNNIRWHKIPPPLFSRLLGQRRGDGYCEREDTDIQSLSGGMCQDCPVRGGWLGS